MACWKEALDIEVVNAGCIDDTTVIARVEAKALVPIWSHPQLVPLNFGSPACLLDD